MMEIAADNMRSLTPSHFPLILCRPLRPGRAPQMGVSEHAVGHRRRKKMIKELKKQ
jgi:hypothetical protein